MKFNNIVSEHIEKYRNEVLKNSSASTFDRKIFSLKKFFEWAVKEGYVDENPVEEFLRNEQEIINTKLGKIEKQRRLATPSYNSTQARIVAKLAGIPKLQKLVYGLFYNRPKWYQSYHSLPIANYFNYAILILLMSGLGFGAYNQFFKTTSTPLAYPTTLTRAGRYLSFQGRLTNNLGNPITTSRNLVFKLYNVDTGGSPLWDSSTCAITPDTDGIFSTLLGSSCGTEIPASVFSENAAIWLGVTVGTDTEATPRVQIATVAYALNSETLQGYPASESATANTIPAINSSGFLVLGTSSPKIQSTSGNFAIEGQTMTITTPDTSNGSITINPDGTGTLNLTFEGSAPGGSAGGFVNATNANITSGALYYGSVASGATGYNLLQLQSGSTPTDKFVVDYAGNVTAAGTVNGLSISSGTISSGTWNGSLVGTQYGGTGADNSTAAQYSIPYYSATGVLGGVLAPDSNVGYVLSTNGASSAPSWIPMSSTGINHWQLGNNILAPINVTNDLTIGGNATGSAFQVFGAPVSSGNIEKITTSTITTGNVLSVTGTALTTGSALYLANNTANNANLIVAQAGASLTNRLTLDSNGLLKIYDSTGTNYVQVDHNGTNGQIYSSSGNIEVGTGAGDMYVGDASNAVDIKFGYVASPVSISGDTGAVINFSQAGNITSAANNTYDLGTNANRWANIYGTNLSSSGYATISGSLALGNTTAADGPGHLNMSGNLTAGGTINGLTVSSGTISSGTWNGSLVGTQYGGTGANNSTAAQYSIPYYSTTGVLGGILTPGSEGYVLTTHSTGGAPTWTDAATVGTNYWQLNSLVLAPANSSAYDLAVGGNSTASAKLLVNAATGNLTTSGTASVSGNLTLGNGSALQSAYGPLTLNYKSGANSWAAGLTVDDMTGYVGVGTTNPTTRFTVSNGGTTGALRFSSDQYGGIIGVTTGGTSGNLYLAPDSGNVQLYNNTATYTLNLYNANTQAISLKSSGDSFFNGGNVGIGTTSPTALLDVAGNASSSGTLTFRGTTDPKINILNGEAFGIRTSVGGDAGLSEVLTLSNSGNLTVTGTINGLTVSSGTISSGTWNGTAIGTQYGGTGKDWHLTAAGSIVYFDAAGSMSTLSPSTNDYVLTTQGSSAPQWKDVTTLVPAATNYWQLNTHVLAPANHVDYDLAIGGTATASSKFQVMAATGNIYTANNTIDWTLNNAADALNFDSNTLSIDALNNRVGIGTVGPDSPLDVLSTGGSQIRLTHTDGSVYTTLNTDSSGNMTIDATGTKTIVADDLQVTGNDILDSGAASRITLGATTTLTNTTTTLSGTTTLTASSLATLTTSANLAMSSTTGITFGGNSTINGGSASAGTLRIDSTSNATKGNLSFNGTTTYIDGLGNLKVGGYATASASLALGNTTAAAGPGHLNMSGNLTTGGTTTFGGIAYTWPTSGQSSGYVLSTNGSGTLSWAAQSGGANYWKLGSGTVSPFSDTLDVLIGNSATSSAKFAFKNVLTGVPTASISGTTANVATFIDGNGNISTTNRANLVLGNSATYNSTGNILLNPNGTGGVGIGTTSPNPAKAALTMGAGSGLNNVSNYSIDAERGIATGGDLQVGSTDYGYIYLGDNAASIAIDTGTFYIDAGTNNLDIGAASTYFHGGNVGIGTNDPTALLDVAGNASSSGTLSFRGTTDPKINILNGENFGISTSVGGDAGLAERFTVLNGGNVGIGTTSPSSRLHVVGSSSVATVGSTNLLTADGTFGSSSGWTVGSWSIGSGVASHASGSITSMLGTSTATSTTTVYQINFTVTSVTTAGTGFSVSLGGSNNSEVFSTTGAKTVYILPAVTNGTLGFDLGAGGTFVGSIDNVTIYALTPSTPDVAIQNSDGSVSNLEFRAGGNNLFNVFTGKDAGKFNTTGTYNTANGIQALYGNVSGYLNEAYGYISLYNNISGKYNVAYGSRTLWSNTTGSYNTANGSMALINNVTGNGNVAMGYEALYASTGSYNLALGYRTGNALSTGSNNIIIGYNIDLPSTSSSNMLDIGNLIYATGINGTETTISTGAVGIGTSSPLAKLHISGGYGGNASLIVDQTLGGDILTASASGSTKMTLTNDGTLKLYNATSSISNTSGDITIDSASGLISFSGDKLGNISQVDIAGDATISGSFVFRGTSPATIDILNGDRLDFQTSPGGDAGLAAKMTLLSNGNVGIGTTSPTQTLDVNGYVRGQRFEDTSSSSYYVDPAASGTSISIDGNIVSNGAFSITSNSTNGDITLNAGSGSVVISGKLDAGTIDPPYTINGNKYATYVASMTGVKEETTGTIGTSEYLAGEGYRATLDFAGATGGSDLWLFSNVTRLSENFDKLVVLLSPATNTKTWYSMDASGKLYIYTSVPTTVSYRLTAPRFDSESWTNDRTSDTAGFIISDTNIWPTGENVTDSDLITFENLKVTISPESERKYDLADSLTGQIIEEVAGLSRAIIANIKAGVIETKELTADSFIAFQGTVDNMLIKSGLVAGSVQTKLISPIPGEDLAVELPRDSKFKIQDSNQNEVVSIDNEGNATFSGTLYAAEIESKSLDEIHALLTQVQADQDFLAQASSWDITATNSANLDEIATANLYVTGQAAMNSLSLTQSLSIGTDMVFQSTIDNQLSTISNSIDTLTSPLKIQSLAMAPVEIMAGMIKIDTAGNVQIAGNLAVKGKVESSGLTLKDTDVQGQTLYVGGATESANLLAVQNSTGENVASINASGSASFANISTQGLTIAGATEATNSAVIDGVITTNATAGSGVIPGDVSEIIIRNPNVTDYTLVYVTPTSSTRNYVLYVKSKSPGEFVVGFTNPIDTDVNFNWWIVRVAQ